MNEWFYPRGALARGQWETVVDDRVTGWQHTGLRVARLDGSSIDLEAGPVERMVVPLAGSFAVATADRVVQLAGRASVFEGPTDVAYVPVGQALTISGTGRVAVAEAPATRVLPAAYLSAAEVPIELRGAGRSSRQVHNFGTPGGLDAERLIVCEVITPAENWSSFPPHKHDQASSTESRLEEIYYFESTVTRGIKAPDTADPFGLFTTYSSPAGRIDLNALVHTGDVALVPFGYHGPAVAAPGYDLYYLNVMAGPSDKRVWNISDDPAHAWVRNTWAGEDVDPRLPYLAKEER